MRASAPTGAAAPVVEVAAAVEGEDRLVGRWTVRQCAWLALATGAALAAAGGWPAPVAVVASGLIGTVALGAALLRPGGRPVESWWTPLFGYCHRARTMPQRRAPRARHRARRLRIPARRRLAGLLLVAAVSTPALLGAGDIRLTRPTRAAPSAPPVPAPYPGVQLARTLAALLAQLAATHGQ